MALVVHFVVGGISGGYGFRKTRSPTARQTTDIVNCCGVGFFGFFSHKSSTTL